MHETSGTATASPAQPPPFAALLREHRAAAGLTQEELAERAGLTVNAVGQLERGQRRRPYPHTVAALAAALGLSDEQRAGLVAASRATPAPAPAAAADPTRPPLPEPPYPIVGREADVAGVLRLRAEARCVTVTGPGGVGKTRLALEVASRLATGGDGGTVAFVPLAPLSDPRLVVPAIARALGCTETGGAPGDRLRTVLEGRTACAVLDNVEHLLDAAADVAALLQACPTLSVLATSRAPLHIAAEREYALGPLPLPSLDHVPTAQEVASAEAARLFVDRARAHAPGFTLTDANAAAVAAICRRLDGLPLALELAAGWIRMLPPSALLARLDDALPLLAGGDRDLPERQRTMRDVVGWSYDLLEPAERRLFDCLAVFSGGWSLEAAQAVADPGADPIEVLRRHASLLDRNLIVVALPQDQDADEPAFAMLETIRAFGRDRLAAGGDHDTVAERHAAFFAALADAAGEQGPGPLQAAWLWRLGRHHDDLGAALDWLASSGRGSDAARIVWGLRWYWYVRGHATEGRRAAARLLASSEGLEPAARARVLAVDALLAFGQGRWDEAAILLDAVDASSPDPPTLAYAELLRGNVAIGQGDLPTAVRCGREARARYRTLGNDAGTGLATAVLVHAALAAGDLDGAEALLDDAERLFRQAGGPWQLAFALNMRLGLAQMRGRGAESLEVARESIALSRSLGDVAALYFGLVGMAEVLTEQGRYEPSARLFGAAEVLAERTGTAMPNVVSRNVYDEHVRLLRDRLDEATVARAWEAGRGLSLPQAIAEALAIP